MRLIPILMLMALAACEPPTFMPQCVHNCTVTSHTTAGVG